MKIPMFNEFDKKLNEAKLVIKRKYTRPKVYEEETVSPRGPVRNRVLSFINEKGKVSETELREFFDSLEEIIGKKPNWSWVRNNAAYIDKEILENGEVYYTLTKRGERVLNKQMQYEAKFKNQQEVQDSK